MSYNFYIQRYEKKYYDGGTLTTIPADANRVDIESTFNCKYVKMEGISENGKAKNIYTESYAETEELRLFIPKDIAYDNTDISLTLCFLAVGDTETDVQTNERTFFEYVSGRKIEYSDTFRNRYVTLVLINKPEVVGEILYGGSRYREVKYTFKNVFGSSFATSQIASS